MRHRSRGQYYGGQWEGNQSGFGHNHSWDRGKRRAVTIAATVATTAGAKRAFATL